MKKKILLADDDIDELNLISGILERGGYDIVISENGEDIEQSDLQLIDLFLLDINMKGIYGTDICRKLKSLQITCNKPVILISAAVELNKEANYCGADDFISKPFGKEVLLERLQRFL
ncbi:MAG: response regulator [Bacteroidetes bacterium]|nr:MAG: response regulator [Bacteroidota bacterium]